MKQGLNLLMPIEIDVEMASVEKIEFKFKQRSVERTFIYPSDEAELDPATGYINLIWLKEDTYKFSPRVAIELDARVTLTGSPYNPETSNITFMMESTLFRENE